MQNIYKIHTNTLQPLQNIQTLLRC